MARKVGIQYVILGAICCLAPAYCGGVPPDDPERLDQQTETRTEALFQALCSVFQVYPGQQPHVRDSPHFRLAMSLFSKEALQNTNISTEVRLKMAGSSLTASGKAIQLSLLGTNFLTGIQSGLVTNLTAILANAQELLSKTPKRTGYLNVMPHSNPGGFLMSGMSPEGIRDPKARADYERRIQTNELAILESNARLDLEQAIRGAQQDLDQELWVFRSSRNDTVIEAIEGAIRSSRMSEESKRALLGKDASGGGASNSSKGPEK